MYSSMFSSIGYGYGRQQDGGIFLVLIVAGVWFLSYLIIRTISRYREFVAVREVAFMSGQPKFLSRVLMKISG